MNKKKKQVLKKHRKKEKLERKFRRLICKPKGALDLSLLADKSEVRCIDKAVEVKMKDMIKECRKSYA